MTAIELNAQLLRQISYIAGDETYLRKTLDYVNKLLRSRSASVTRGSAYTELLERLSDYQEYQLGWDGDDALPLDAHVVKNFKRLLQKSQDQELTGWTIFPAANGTLLLQNKFRKSGINIGVSGFSYYTTVDGKTTGETNLRFTPRSVLNIMGRI